MRLTRLLCLLLALSVALVSAHGPRMRLAEAGAITVELCSGGHTGAPATLRIGWQGQPLAPHAACPDCVLAGVADLAALPPAAGPAGAGRRFARRSRAPAVAAAQPPARRARGPPPAV